MKEEEIRPIAENYVEEYCHLPDGEYTDGSLVCAGIGTALIVSRQLEKRIAELEEKISILLSCKNCPDNKGGLLCQKEYEDKCLAQKIQYIKELKEEIADLEAKYLQATDEGTSWYHLKSLEKENAELKCFIRDLIYENQNLCFQFSNTTCLFNSDYRNRAKELIGEKL